MKAFIGRHKMLLWAAYLFCLGLLAFSGVSMAQFRGRLANEGYFTGTLDLKGDKVFSNGLPENNVNAFVDRIKWELRGDAPVQYRVGAAFIIHTMLGRSAGNWPRPPSSGDIAEWENRVRYLDSIGRVAWNENYNYTVNSYWQGNNVGPNPHDNAFYLDTGTKDSIVFRNPSGAIVYVIKHDCANPLGDQGLGDFPGLPPTPPPSTSYTVQGFRVNTALSALPDGAGTTTVGGSSTSSNPYFFGVSGSTNSTASATINVGGVTYNRVGYTLCVDRTDCHTGPVNRSSSVHLPDKSGGFYDLWWHYEEAPPPWDFSCDHITTPSPTPVEVGQPFTVTLRIRGNGGGTQPSYSYTHNFNPGSNPGPMTVLSRSPSPSGTIGSSSTSNISYTFRADTPGRYSGSISVTADGKTRTCSFSNSSSYCPGCSPIPVANRPFIRTYGGDVVAGIRPNCPGWVSATPNASLSSEPTIIANNHGGSPNYGGSGAQLAVQAAGAINGFISGSFSPGLPKWLTFSNAVGTYGGNFNPSNCPEDYYGRYSASGVVSGPTTLTAAFGGPTTNITGNHTVVIDGDLMISNDVTFGAWSGVNNIPSLKVIVRGNIYIQHGVNELMGIYVAQPNSAASNNNVSNRGIIYTCAVGTNPPNTAQLRTSCNSNRLRVNGVFLALGIRVYRTIGTIGGESANSSSSSTQASEIMNFHPFLWLSPEPCTNSCFDSVTALPPVL